jgi:hypothetical protein
MVDVLETTIIITIVIGNNIMHITKDTPTSMDHQLTQLTLVPNGIQIKSTFNNIPMEDKYKVVLLTKVQCEERDGINHHNNDRVIHHKAIKDKVVVDQSKGDRVVQVEVEADNSRMEIFFTLKKYPCRECQSHCLYTLMQLYQRELMGRLHPPSVST